MGVVSLSGRRHRPFGLPCAAHDGRGLAELASLKQLRSLIRPSLRCSAAPQRPLRDTTPITVDRAVVCSPWLPPSPSGRGPGWGQRHQPLDEPGMRCGVGGPSVPPRSAAFRGQGIAAVWAKRVLRDPAKREHRREARRAGTVGPTAPHRVPGAPPGSTHLRART